MRCEIWGGEAKGSGRSHLTSHTAHLTSHTQGAEPMLVKPIPEGYHSLTPLLVVPGVANLIEFVKEAFGAQEIFRFPGPDGRIAHAEVKIGDSMLMMGEPSEGHPPMPAMIHL